MDNNAADFIKIVRHPFKFRFFLFSKLPAAFFSGVRVRDIDESKCVVSVPFKWLTQNPFRSTYFASLSMAAEMSTGALALANIYKRNPPVSMLVVKVESEYFKKAIEKTFFTCNDGQLFYNAVEESIKSGEGQIVKAKSIGLNQKGEVVAEFFVTWSFKAKTN